jgi:hypothetical protein
MRDGPAGLIEETLVASGECAGVWGMAACCAGVGATGGATGTLSVVLTGFFLAGGNGAGNKAPPESNSPLILSADTHSSVPSLVTKVSGWTRRSAA